MSCGNLQQISSSNPGLTMVLPQYYLAALLTPRGRLDQFGFAVLSIALAFAHVWVYAEIKRGNSLDAWGPNTIALFVMLWMMFCIMSRRLHDTGSTGFFLVPLLIFAVFVFFAAIDPDQIAAGFRATAVGDLTIHHGMKILRSLAVAGFLYLIRAGGQDGENAYGPEFGDGPLFGGAAAGAKRSPEAALERIASQQTPQNTYRRIRDDKPHDWGQRPANKGFGRR